MLRQSFARRLRRDRKCVIGLWDLGCVLVCSFLIQYSMMNRLRRYRCHLVERLFLLCLGARRWCWGLLGLCRRWSMSVSEKMCWRLHLGSSSGSLNRAFGNRWPCFHVGYRDCERL